MTTPATGFEEVSAAIPSDLLGLSGKVFYSGRDAFMVPAQLYVLGGNPGGDPDEMQHETVESHTVWVGSTAPADWSAYRDESWKGREPGRHGMQPRILHMLERVGLNAGSVPASNVVFVRSRREGDLRDFNELATRCWPLHALVIERLKPKVVLCLGKTSGDFVRSRLGVHHHVGTFTEQNARRWQSHSFRDDAGRFVVVASHPSIANWATSATDPTGLIVDALHAL